MDVFYRANVTDGLFQSEWFMDDGKPNSGKFVLKKSYDLLVKSQPFFPLGHVHITIGATTDSGYEYLLKQWIQSGDPKARQQCKQVFYTSFFFIS